MAKIILVNGINPLSVKLQFDLLLHGKACRAFTDGKAQLKIIENALCEAVVDNHIDLLHAKRADAEHSLLVAEKNLRHERDTLSVELTALSGSLHWLTIKRMLSNQCNHNNPLEKELSSSLTMSEPSEMAPPLAIESLDHSFIELLKNSMDAIIKKYIAHVSDNLMLEMDVALFIQGEKIVITITDNAGGFDPAYVTQFSDSIKSKSYKLDARLSEKQQESRFFFGGAGRGIPILCNLIMDGEELESPGVSRKRYQVTQGESSISIGNDPLKNGAQIILVSPLAPFPHHVEKLIHEPYLGSANISNSQLIVRRLKMNRYAIPPLQIARAPAETAQIFNPNSSVKSSQRVNHMKRPFFAEIPLLNEDSERLFCNKVVRA